MIDVLSFALTSIYSVIATFFMSIFGFLAYIKWGLRGSLELFESQRMYDILMKKIIKYELTNHGILIHIINGWLLGLPFLLLVYFDILSSELIIWGIFYGIVVWVLTLAPVHKFLTKDSIISHPLGIYPIMISLIGHITYGFVISSLISYGGFFSV
jgi:hypothetical protein